MARGDTATPATNARRRERVAEVIMQGGFRAWNKQKSNAKARCYVSQVDKWEAKEADTYMSVHDQLRHR